MRIELWEYSINLTTERKRYKISGHTIQDTGKRIMRKKIVQKTPIDGAVQQKLCWKDTKYTFRSHFIRTYQTFISPSLYRCKENCSILFPSSWCEICSLWAACSTADRNWSFEMFRTCKVILSFKSPKVTRLPR